MDNDRNDYTYKELDAHIESVKADKQMTLKELIKSLGMSQKEFADEFHIPMGTLRHWIAGERKCPEYTMRMLKYMVEIKRASERGDSK